MICDRLFYYLVLLNMAENVLGERDAKDEGLIHSRERKKLLIDTDAGADDGMAILNILGAEYLFHEVQVQLITTVRGNTHVDNVCRNVLKILKTADRLDIPVYKGANQSLLVTPKTDDYFGQDGFGDFDFPNPPSEELLKPEHAVTALIKEVDTHPGELTLVCLGPLTNIALALRLDPQFFNKLKEIYVLGGSDSGVGNVKPGVEFNFYVDPEAAHIVFKEAEKSNKILNVVTWETAAIRNVVSMDWRKNVFGNVKSPQVDLINKAENKVLNGETWVCSDAVLASIIIDSEIKEASDLYHADIEISGEHSRGAVFIDSSNLTNLAKNVLIVKKINVERYKALLLQNLRSYEGMRSHAASIS